MINPFTLPRFEEAVKQMLIASYFNHFYGRLPPGEFVLTLHRIFQRKEKVIRNLAIYVQREVEEKDRPADKVLQSLDFYAKVLKEFVDKVTNQPMRQP